MKRTIIFLINLCLIGYINFNSPAFPAGSGVSSNDSTIVMSTPELYSLTYNWAREYNNKYPDQKIRVESIPATGMGENLEKGVPGFISGENTAGFNNESFTKVVVAHDIIVPVINAANPLLNEIKAKGLSKEKMGMLFGNQQASWGSLINNDNQATAGVYILDDNSVSRGISSFLGIESRKLNGRKLENANEVIASVLKDPYAIGFCKLVNILNNEKGVIGNLAILPIDRNNNGAIDSNEDIYSDMNAFSRGVWIGKYPRELFSNIYSVATVRSDNQPATAFLKWVLNDGQSVLQNNGYSDLLANERQSGTDRISEAQAPAGIATGTRSVFGTMFIIIAVLLVAVFGIDYLIRTIRSRPREVASEYSGMKALDENSMIFPGGVYFDKTHSWAFMEQNGYIKTGIDDFLQHLTGPISKVKLKNAGDEVKKGEELMTIIQNGKQLTVYSPVSGVIRERNSTVSKDASVLNKSPYTEGWVYRIEPQNWSRENQLLFMAEKQKQFIKDEIVRFKDFLATLLTGDKAKYAAVVLQDGGAVMDGTLSEMGPEVWEEFQTRFIDKSKQIWFYEII
jgi:glycine cleavage system H lipoate-binding protein/ABC-type phosphate transport system substrate-binding protein